jgi:hypothetical protein
MSNLNVQLSKLEEIHIDSEDCDNILDFLNNTSVEKPQALIEALKEFKKNISDVNFDHRSLLEIQDKIRINLCELIATSEHPLFSDDLMKEAVENSKKITFLANFDKQAGDILSED